MSVTCECCLLSSKGLCVETLVQWSPTKCDMSVIVKLDSEDALAKYGLLRHGKKKYWNVPIAHFVTLQNTRTNCEVLVNT
jgi:hypothetical protein